MTPTTINKLITPEELAERLCIPIKRLYTWRLNGRGPTYIKVGHSLRYRAEDVAQWLDDNAHDPAI